MTLDLSFIGNNCFTIPKSFKKKKNLARDNDYHLILNPQFIITCIIPFSGRGLHEFGDVGNWRYHLPLSLLLAWIFIFICIIKGTASSGKVGY